MTFLGVAWLQRRKGHVAVDIIVTHLKPLPQRIMGLANLILGAFISGTLTTFGAIATWNSLQAGQRIIGILFTPEWIILIIIPLGSFLLFVQFLRDIYAVLAKGRFWAKGEAVTLG
jgi:TRAP-type C4-dicarboxylate transport system permease small subunit